MPHLKLRDDAELYYETHGSGPPLFLVPRAGRRRPFWGDNVAALAKDSPWSCTITAARARSTLSKIAYSVEQMAEDALQLIDRLGYKRVHWCGIRPAAPWARCWRSSIPTASTAGAELDLGQDRRFFRRLFEVRSLMLRELGPAAYLKSSALALNMPSWVRDHDGDLSAAEARANETIPVPEIVLSASPPSWPMIGASSCSGCVHPRCGDSRRARSRVPGWSRWRGPRRPKVAMWSRTRTAC